MIDTDAILQLKNITKNYLGVVAVNNVTIEITKGEVHALVGENGSGKSTLIKTCTGEVIPDYGSVIVDGKIFSTMTPKLAKENSIAVIYQESTLIGELSVAENIFLGRTLRKGLASDKKTMINASREIFKSFDIKIDPEELVSHLTVGYQQIVEIAKAIAQKAQILIMDMSFANLTQLEVESICLMIDKLKKTGVTIIYIAHKMDEIFRLTDRITVMRKGNKMATLKCYHRGTHYWRSKQCAEVT